MSRVIVAVSVLIIFCSVFSSRTLKYQDLSELLIEGDESGIEKAGYKFWKKDEDGFVGYQKNQYEHQIWLNPYKELHFSSEGEEEVDGSIPDHVKIERFNDGPVYVLFVYPKDADQANNNSEGSLEEKDVSRQK
jgi:hypothetical protein